MASLRNIGPDIASEVPDADDHDLVVRDNEQDRHLAQSGHATAAHSGTAMLVPRSNLCKSFQAAAEGFDPSHETVRTFETIAAHNELPCIEEIAFVKGYIDTEQLLARASEFPNSTYGAYLRRVASEQAVFRRAHAER